MWPHSRNGFFVDVTVEMQKCKGLGVGPWEFLKLGLY